MIKSIDGSHVCGVDLARTLTCDLCRASTSEPVAVSRSDGTISRFCSHRCADRFDEFVGLICQWQRALSRYGEQVVKEESDALARLANARWERLSKCILEARGVLFAKAEAKR